MSMNVRRKPETPMSSDNCYVAAAAATALSSSTSFSPPSSASSFSDDHQKALRFKYPTIEEAAASGRFDPTGVEVVTHDGALGRGVRARRAFKRGDIVCTYGGRVCSLASVRRAATDGAYRYEWLRDLFIDGDPKLPEARGHLGSFINDALGTLRLPGCKNNVRFCNGHFRAPDGKRRYIVWIRAKRRIAPGECLWLAYGADYWNIERLLARREDRGGGEADE